MHRANWIMTTNRNKNLIVDTLNKVFVSKYGMTDSTVFIFRIFLQIIMDYLIRTCSLFRFDDQDLNDLVHLQK